MHGGKTPRGAASPHFKHGRYSRYLHPSLQERYAESVTDMQLLALKDEIAILDVRASQLVGRLESGETEGLWAEGRRLIKAVQANKGGAKAAELLRELFDIIERGAASESCWSELGDLFQDRRRLVESERKRMVEMQLYITAEQFTMLVEGIAKVLRENVHDVEVLARVLDGIDLVAGTIPR